MTLNDLVLIHINKIYIMDFIKKNCTFVTNEKIHQKVFCAKPQRLNPVLAILPDATSPLCTGLPRQTSLSCLEQPICPVLQSHLKIWTKMSMNVSFILHGIIATLHMTHNIWYIAHDTWQMSCDSWFFSNYFCFLIIF